MPCLDENTIARFFEGALEDEVAARVDEHTAECEACRRVIAQFAAIHAQAGDATVREVSLPAPSSSDSRRAELARKLAYAQAARRVGTWLQEKWRIDALLGIGGMAQVFAATHRNGRRVAIKIMRPELAVEPSLVQRFLREGYVANKIEHPGTVAVIDDDVLKDGTPILVMDLLVGRTLGQKLADRGPLPLEEVLRIGDEVLDVLAAAHAKGIVHRDLKPDNLFETESGAIKVLDFGIARLREQLGTDTATQSGMMMGTPGYMPPEQARGQSSVDARADVWALGATLLTLVTGRPVHEARTANEALLLAMTSRVAPVATLAPFLPSAVCAVLDRALAFERDARFASAREMRESLRSARCAPAEGATRPEDMPVFATLPKVAAQTTKVAASLPPPHSARGRRRWAWGSRVLAALSVVALGAWAYRTRGSAGQQAIAQVKTEASAPEAPNSSGATSPTSSSPLAPAPALAPSDTATDYAR